MNDAVSMPPGLESLPSNLFSDRNPVFGRLAGPVDSSEIKRVNVRPVTVKGRTVHQFEYIKGAKAFHLNLDAGEAREELANLLPQFRSAVLHTSESDYHITVKPGGIRVKRSPPTRAPAVEPHDADKVRSIPEGTPNPYLTRLGVMTPDGRVIAARRDKYRQINRFIEMVGDVEPHLPKSGPIRVVDFGCGKSYLTFAVYHLLHEKLGREVRIIGLDLKQDVITHCSLVARDLRYEGLTFQAGDIGGYEAAESVDMVVSLHACDTATDDALAKAVEWESKVILSVPCCQHELNKQLKNPVMQPMLKHGIIRERLTEIVTDSARAALLETCGYSVQLMEFIATEHTPKNLLIRAVKQARKPALSKAEQYRKFADFWGISPKLEKVLSEIGRI